MIPFPKSQRTGRGGQCDICKIVGVPLIEVLSAHGKIMTICQPCFLKFGGGKWWKSSDDFDEDFHDKWSAEFEASGTKQKRVKSFDRLFKKDNTGKIRIWDITVDTDGTDFIINTSSGLEGGKIKQDAGTRISVGKVNRTAKQQALQEATSKWADKIAKGYHDNKLDALGSTRVNPMLAARYDKPAKARKIVFPVIGQRKFDGVRGMARVVPDGGFLNDISITSRTNRQWPELNHIRQQVANLKIPENIILDGEIYSHQLTFNRLNGLTKKIKLDAKDRADLLLVNFRIYDVVDTNNPTWAYKDRYRYLKKLLKSNPQSNLLLTKNFRIDNPEEIMPLHQQFLDEGFEGLMLRNLDGKYRGTRSSDLQKVKKFEDKEYTVVGYKEGRGNAAGTPVWICETDEGHQFGATPMGTRAEKEELWKNKDELVGEKVTVQYFPPADPVTGIPRHPYAKGFRSKQDLPEEKEAEYYTPTSIYRVTARQWPRSGEGEVYRGSSLSKSFLAFDMLPNSTYEKTIYRDNELVLVQKYDYMTGNNADFLEVAKARYGDKYRFNSEQEDTSVSCEICGKTFDSFRGLNGHRNAHIERKAAEHMTDDEFTEAEIEAFIEDSISRNIETTVKPYGWAEAGWATIKQSYPASPWDDEIIYEFEYDEEEDIWKIISINQPYDVSMAYPYYMSYRVTANSPEDAETEARDGTGYRHGDGDLSKYPVFTYRSSFSPDYRDASVVHGEYEAESVTTDNNTIKTSKLGKLFLVSGVTFMFFFGEAIIHYNLGEAEGGTFGWDLPPTKELLKIGVIVAGFSVLSGLTVSVLEKHLRT